MTNQAVFNKVVKHLLTQKKRSTVKLANNEMMCAYRGTNNLKCAIGVLIPNTRYRESFEGTGLFDPFSELGNPVLKAAGLTVEQGDLGEALQSVHDRVQPSRWPTALRRVAKDFNLKLPAELA